MKDSFIAYSIKKVLGDYLSDWQKNLLLEDSYYSNLQEKRKQILKKCTKLDDILNGGIFTEISKEESKYVAEYIDSLYDIHNYLEKKLYIKGVSDFASFADEMKNPVEDNLQ